MMSLLQQPIYLASTSPRRHELLNQINITHQVLHVPAPDGEDEPIFANESAIDYVQRTALNKLQHAVAWRASQSQLIPNWAILCADTTVELDGAILGKPLDLTHAAYMLQQLSGRIHLVHTAISLAYQGQRYSALSTSQIQFKNLSKKDIATYCLTQEPLGKAGAYGIQGVAAIFIEKLIGSYSSVMGLDLYQTHQLCIEAGL